MKNHFFKAVTILAGTLFIGAGLCTIGCGSSKYDYPSVATEAYETAAADYAYDMDDAYLFDGGEVAAGSEGSASADIVEDNTSASNRKLITTVNMSLETNDMATCIAGIREKTWAVGGYLESESIYAKSCSFVARVPAASLDQFLDAVRSKGNVTYYSSSVEDVTLNYVDIKSRIDSLRTEQKRLDELLGGAETMEEIIALEQRLSEVRYELQSYESQRRTYDDKIDYSTVYIDVSEVEVYTPEVKATAGERIKLKFADSLVSLKNGLTEFFVGFIGNLPVILFWLTFFGGIFCAIFFPIRAGKKRRAKKAALKAEKAALKAEKKAGAKTKEKETAPQDGASEENKK